MTRLREFMDAMRTDCVYHCTPEDFDPRAVEPFTHFGTLTAAIGRGAHWMQGYGSLEYIDIYEFRLVNPVVLALPDHDRDGIIHTGKFLAQQVSAALGEVVSPDNLGEVLASRGINCLSYTNGVEDIGSTSWIVIDPKVAVFTGEVESLDRDDLIERGML